MQPARFRRSTILAIGAAGFALLGTALPAAAQGNLRVGMTLADIPTTGGAPDQGSEGLRFAGYPVYDALINWDLSKADVPSVMTPGLATSWEVDASDQTVWRFKLREGVTFHDGSPWNADAAIWNFDKIFNKDAPQYDARQAGQVTWRLPGVKTWRKIDAMTIEVGTHGPDSMIPYQMTGLLFSSPARWEELGRNWNAFMQKPSGTGPWIIERAVPREVMQLGRNTAFWDKARVPKAEKLTLLPLPDASARTAALLAGRVDWIESPSPDALPRLKAAGFKIVTGPMPHLWPYTLSRAPGSPMNDIKVRKALNLAVDRDGIVKLLGGLALPSKGVVTSGHAWFGKPTFDLKYDPAEARKLLKEAGYGPEKPLKIKFMISTSGSGQMYPLPMNEYIQQTLKDVGVDLEFEVLEWQALRARRDLPGGAIAPANAGIHALNNSWGQVDPMGAFIRHVDSAAIPPKGLNWGGISEPGFDKLVAEAKNEFDLSKQDAILARINERMMDEAVWIFVVHDVAPRAISPKVQGMVQAQSWFVDFSPVSIQ